MPWVSDLWGELTVIEGLVLSVVLLGITVFNLVVGATEATWRLYGWRTPTAGEQIAWPDPVAPGREQLAFDLIVPLRDEANVIVETLHGLLRQTHPRYRIVVSLCDDDEATMEAVRAVVRENLHDNVQRTIRDNRITVVVDHYANYARVELAAFDAAVTDWELRRCFERL